jgi:hypothetical protein
MRLQTRNKKQETRNQKTKNQKPETRNQKPETSNVKSETKKLSHSTNPKNDINHILRSLFYRYLNSISKHRTHEKARSRW